MCEKQQAGYGKVWQERKVAKHLHRLNYPVVFSNEVYNGNNRYLRLLQQQLKENESAHELCLDLCF